MNDGGWILAGWPLCHVPSVARQQEHNVLNRSFPGSGRRSACRCKTRRDVRSGSSSVEHRWRFRAAFEIAMGFGFIGFVHALGYAGTAPLWLIAMPLLAASVWQLEAVQRRVAGADFQGRLTLRLAIEAALATAVIYSIGWGPVLGVAYVVMPSEHLRKQGSAAWRPAMVFTAIGVAIGQTVVALGWAFTYVATPEAHALALLDVVAVGMILRLLGGAFEDRERAEHALVASEHRFRALVQRSSDVIATVDADGTVTYVSPGIEWVAGVAPENAVGMHVLDGVHPDEREEAERLFTDVLRLGPTEEVRGELRVRHADGEWHWHEMRVRNLLSDPAVRSVVANHRDVTERRNLQERLSWEATHDALTGLPNRSEFLRALADAARLHDGDHLGVLFIDLDRFKDVNDTFGHAAGDVLLGEAAARIAAVVRQGDVVARLGGDEFVVLVRGARQIDDVHALVARIEEAIERPFQVGKRAVSVSASIGIAIVDGPIDDVESILRDADLAMYAAKKQSRGSAMFEPGLHWEGVVSSES
jgi:diguanylate cyclase (GGDEF)-like protein/PAS domain S-box-containing protein